MSVSQPVGADAIRDNQLAERPGARSCECARGPEAFRSATETPAPPLSPLRAGRLLRPDIGGQRDGLRQAILAETVIWPALPRACRLRQSSWQASDTRKPAA